MELKFTIFGNPKTKKNSQRIVMVGKYPRIIQSKEYLAYEKQATAQLLKSINSLRDSEMGCAFPISSPVNVKAVYYRLTLRRVDITNLESALMDILVKAGVLEDDNFKIVVSTDGSRVRHDKQNPRTEITITDAIETENKTQKPTGFSQEKTDE